MPVPESRLLQPAGVYNVLSHLKPDKCDLSALQSPTLAHHWHLDSGLGWGKERNEHLLTRVFWVYRYPEPRPCRVPAEKAQIQQHLRLLIHRF